MASAGIGGVEIQPVYPLMLDDESKGIKNLPYLSPEFLDDIAFANRTARALGLRVDITLGSGWPYGGPHTPLALAAGCLRVVSVPITNPTVTPPALQPGDTFIAAFAIVGSEKSFDPATAQQIDLTTGRISPHPKPDTPYPIPLSTALFFVASHTRQAVKRAAYGAEGFVLDHFSRPAIDEHIADVATPLINAFGDQPPYSVFSDSLEVYGSDWTPNLPAEFLRRRGYDLIPHLPELLAGGSPQADSVRHDWGLTLSDLIRENYLSPAHTLRRVAPHPVPLADLRPARRHPRRSVHPAASRGRRPAVARVFLHSLGHLRRPSLPPQRRLRRNLHLAPLPRIPRHASRYEGRSRPHVPSRRQSDRWPRLPLLPARRRRARLVPLRRRRLQQSQPLVPGHARYHALSAAHELAPPPGRARQRHRRSAPRRRRPGRLYARPRLRHR